MHLLDILSGQSELERKMAEEIAALKELDDHELADLGILRDQIVAHVERAAGIGRPAD